MQNLTAMNIRWAYRFLLGRDPESDFVIDNWCKVGSIVSLRDGILSSPEMAELALSGFPENGTWVDGKPTDEAISTLLALLEGKLPDTELVQEFRLRHLNLRSMRRFLLTSPSIERRLPEPEGPRTRKLRLADLEMTLRGDSREPEFNAAPGFAPRYAALLRAAWPDGGEGRVIVEGGAGIGVETLGLAAGAPRHQALVAHEVSVRKAATLAENLRENGLTNAVARTAALRDVPSMMAMEDLPRLDLLRLNEPGAARLAIELAPWLSEREAITLISFDLADLLTEEGPGPRAVLTACHRAFPHVVTFGPLNEPHLLLDKDSVDAALHRALMRPDRRDEFILCHDLDWIERFIFV